MESQNQQEQLIEQLVTLNSKLTRQSSIKHIFLMGIIYGVGFFIGSAILATIALGILSPWIGQVDWVKSNYDRGVELQ